MCSSNLSFNHWSKLESLPSCFCNFFPLDSLITFITTITTSFRFFKEAYGGVLECQKKCGIPRRCKNLGCGHILGCPKRSYPISKSSKNWGGIFEDGQEFPKQTATKPTGRTVGHLQGFSPIPSWLNPLGSTHPLAGPEPSRSRWIPRKSQNQSVRIPLPPPHRPPASLKPQKIIVYKRYFCWSKPSCFYTENFVCGIQKLATENGGVTSRVVWSFGSKTMDQWGKTMNQLHGMFFHKMSSLKVFQQKSWNPFAVPTECQNLFVKGIL